MRGVGGADLIELHHLLGRWVSLCFFEVCLNQFSDIHFCRTASLVSAFYKLFLFILLIIFHTFWFRSLSDTKPWMHFSIKSHALFPEKWMKMSTSRNVEDKFLDWSLYPGLFLAKTHPAFMFCGNQTNQQTETVVMSLCVEVSRLDFTGWKCEQKQQPPISKFNVLLKHHSQKLIVSLYV